MPDGMSAVVNEPGGTAYGARILDPGLAMAGKSGTSQIRHITDAEREHGLPKGKQVPWKDRDHALFISFAPVGNPRYVCAVVVEHGGAEAERRLGGGGADLPRPADRWRKSAIRRGAFRPSRSAAPPWRRTENCRRCVGSTTSPRPEQSLAVKLVNINWDLVALVTGIACIGFAMLYSAANGSWQPWAERQLLRYAVAALLMLAVAVVDIRLWLRAAYTFYALTLLLLIAVQVRGAIGMGAQRWIDLGVIQLQPSELMKIALDHGVGALFQQTDARGGRPTREADRAGAAGAGARHTGAEAARSRHGDDAGARRQRDVLPCRRATGGNSP